MNKKIVSWIFDMIMLIVAWFIVSGDLYDFLVGIISPSGEVTVTSMFLPAFIIFGLMVLIPLIRWLVLRRFDE